MEQKDSCDPPSRSLGPSMDPYRNACSLLDHHKCKYLPKTLATH